MALIVCPECGENISSYAEACPYCGYPMKNDPAKNNNTKYSSPPQLSPKGEKPSGKYNGSTIAFDPNAHVYEYNDNDTNDDISYEEPISPRTYYRNTFPEENIIEEKLPEKSEGSILKRIISWIVLLVIIVAVEFVASFAIGILDRVFDFMSQLDTSEKILIYFVFGAFIISLLFAPISYGYAFIVGISEAISPTKTGLRYVLAGGYNLVMEIVYLIKRFSVMPKSNITLSVLMCIFYAALVFTGINHASKSNQ